MYNSSIFDDKLTKLSFNHKINKEFSLEDIKNSNNNESNLWNVFNNGGGVLKLIPLFNCDKIISSNSDDIVLDKNKCIICINNDSTIISCITENKGDLVYYGLNLHAFAIYPYLIDGKLDVYCVAFDDFNHLIINEEISVYINNEYVGSVLTNINGICKFTVDNPCNIQFKKDNVESETLNILNQS